MRVRLEQDNLVGQRTWHRWLAILAAVLFLVSAVFPVTAGLARNIASFPKWWGAADVSLAFVLGLLVLLLVSVTQNRISKAAEVASYRAYRILTHGILVLLVIFFLAGDRVTWINCATGFAWRIWLLLYSLPAWFAALATSATPSPGL